MKNAVLLAACIVTALALFGCEQSTPTSVIESPTGAGSLELSYSGALTGTLNTSGAGGNAEHWSAPGVWPYLLLPHSGVTAQTYLFEVGRQDPATHSTVPSGMGVHTLSVLCQTGNDDGTFNQLIILLSRYDSVSGSIHPISESEIYRGGDFLWRTPALGRQLRAKVRLFTHLTSIDSTSRDLSSCFTSPDDGSATVMIVSSHSAHGIDNIAGTIDANLFNPMGEHIMLHSAQFNVSAPRDSIGLY